MYVLTDCTSSRSSEAEKAGERLLRMGSPSTTYCVSYSEARGWTTPLASSTQPGCDWTTSIAWRPGMVAAPIAQCGSAELICIAGVRGVEERVGIFYFDGLGDGGDGENHGNLLR